MQHRKLLKEEIVIRQQSNSQPWSEVCTDDDRGIDRVSMSKIEIRNAVKLGKVRVYWYKRSRSYFFLVNTSRLLIDRR